MRRLIALAAVTAAVPALALAAPATAQSATTAAAPATAKPGNPVDALRLQFAKKSGVRVDENTRMGIGKQDIFAFRETGKLRFGRSGVDAYDAKITLKGFDKDGDSTVRAIVVGGRMYLKSALYEELLPAGRTWVRTSGKASTYSNGPIDLLKPNVLKAILATAKAKSPGGTVGGARTTLVRGSIPLSSLGRVSPMLSSIAKSEKSKKITVPWRMWIGADQLPRRFQTTVKVPVSPSTGSSMGDVYIAADNRYTSWGAKVVITAPPADLVVDEKDLTDELPVIPDLTTKIPGVPTREH
ncbi:hypothetical protein ACWEN6_31645 [Sphaerisporangium sp. NPDC004334]